MGRGGGGERSGERERAGEERGEKTEAAFL